MSNEKLPDLDYFTNEELDDDFGEEGFYIFLSSLESLGKCALFILSNKC